MMKKLKIVFAVTLFFSATTLLQAERQRKDPFLAGVLSWSWSGLGHFYAQDYTKGSLFLTAGLAQTATAIGLVVHYSNQYTDESKGDRVIEWRELSSLDQAVVVTFILGTVFIKGWSVFDAVESAKAYNRRYFPEDDTLSSNKVKMYYTRRRTEYGPPPPGRESEYTNQVGVRYRF